MRGHLLQAKAVDTWSCGMEDLVLHSTSGFNFEQLLNFGGALISSSVE